MQSYYNSFFCRMAEDVKRPRLEGEHQDSQLVLLIPDLLETLCRYLPPQAIAVLAASNRSIRKKLRGLAKPWEKVCSSLDFHRSLTSLSVPAEGADQDEEYWAFNCYEDFWTYLRQQHSPQVRNVLRCYVSMKLNENPHIFRMRRDLESLQWEQPEKKAEDLYTSVKKSSRKEMRDAIYHTTMSYAYSEDYFVTAHSRKDLPCLPQTRIKAWPLFQPSEEVSEATVSYELPFQHVLIWKNFLLYIPFPDGICLLEARDIENRLALAGRIRVPHEGEENEDELREEDDWLSDNMQRLHPAEYKMSGPSRIYTFGDRILLVDCPQWAEPDSLEKADIQWTIFFLTVSKTSCGKVNFKLLHRVNVPKSSRAAVSLVHSDQHAANIVLEFYVKVTRCRIVVSCNMDSCAAHLLINEKNSITAGLVSPSAIYIGCSSQIFQPDVGLPGALPGRVPEAILLTRSARCISLGKKKLTSPSLSSWPCDAHDMVVAHGANVVACALVESRRGEGTMETKTYVLVGVHLATLHPIWHFEHGQLGLHLPLARSKLNSQMAKGTYQDPVLLSRFGLVFLASLPTGVKVIDAVNGMRLREADLDLPPFRRVLPEFGSSTTFTSDVDSGFYANRSGLWDLEILPPSEKGEKSRWRLLVVHDLERFAPLAFDVITWD